MNANVDVDGSAGSGSASVCGTGSGRPNGPYDANIRSHRPATRGLPVGTADRALAYVLAIADNYPLDRL